MNIDDVIALYSKKFHDKNYVAYLINDGQLYLRFDDKDSVTADGINIYKINEDGTYEEQTGIGAVIDWHLNLNEFIFK